MYNKKIWLIYAMLILATSMWGSAFIAGKIAIESFEPATIAFFRFFGAAILLFPLMWIKAPIKKDIKMKVVKIGIERESLHKLEF